MKLMKCLLFVLTILFSVNISFAGCKYSDKGLRIPIPDTYGSSGLMNFSPWIESIIQIDPEVLRSGGKVKSGNPDMNIKTVRVSNGAKSKRKHKLIVSLGESIYVHSKISEKAGANAYNFKLRFYIDDDKDFDKKKKHRLETVEIDKFNAKAMIRYTEGFYAPEKSGIYYLWSCIEDLENDKKKKNNCSKEKSKKEYGKIKVFADPKPIPEPIITEPDGSSPIYKIEEGGYFTKYTLNPMNPNDVEIIGYGFAEPQEGTVPVHEFDSGKQYFYVATDWERDNVFEDKDWDYLGIVFHAYPAGSTEGEPFWRLWHYDSGTHDWTSDLSLRNYWETSGSHRSEGNAWQILDPRY